MTYADPNYLNTIVAALMALVIFYLWAMRRRRVLLGLFAEKNLLGGIAPSVSMRRKVLKMAIVTSSVLLSILALARPQWGFEWTQVKRSGLDILIAVDVSKSMLSRDVKPNRLERSKFAVKDLIKKLSGDRMGLIAFSGNAFLQCPLTIDYNGFLLALEDLSVETIPRGGTSISSAIREALATFKGPEKKYKVLVIITDGDDLEGDAAKEAKASAKEGVKIYCVGVGTTEGDLIPVVNEMGDRTYMEDRSGNVVKTRLNEEKLKEIAISTGGSYVRATQAQFGLVLLYDKSISQLEKRDIESKMKKRYDERFQVFLAFAVAFLFIEPLISERKRLPA